MRALKGKRQITMLFVDQIEEAAAASEAGVDMLSIVSAVWTEEMREAAGDCFVQVGLVYRDLCTRNSRPPEQLRRRSRSFPQMSRAR
jgi:3-methyl-2-oxobutanoate hydroxymethyltransferase